MHIYYSNILNMRYKIPLRVTQLCESRFCHFSSC